MYVEHVTSKQGSKIYTQILLRESYRVKGEKRSRVKHRTIANLTHAPAKDVKAIEWGLKHKQELSRLKEEKQGIVKIRQGFIVGAVMVLWHMAHCIGLSRALGRSRPARLALWLVFARLIDQGSRLSAVRLAQRHAVCEIMGIEGFNEDDLYQAMDWLDERQHRIEKALFRGNHHNRPSNLFLYDVTSSYLEGTCNSYGAYGYNRDGKKGKEQIVVGLLSDEDGVPVSIEVFDGNTQDPMTVASQIRKLAESFGVLEVTFVGDRGMLKSTQIEKLNEASLRYLTAITKPQIETLLKRGALQLNLFEETLCEVKIDKTRYILRRNPLRVQEIAAVREDKFRALCDRAKKRTTYLKDHHRASLEIAEREVRKYAEKLRINNWVEVRAEGCRILVIRNEAKLKDISRLDGCYVLKSDVPSEMATAEQLHTRYKDLSKVERAFRTKKSAHLQVCLYKSSYTRTRFYRDARLSNRD